MKKKILYVLTGLILLLNLGIVISGRWYLYPALYHNFADIDDYKIFPNRPIEAGTPQPWPVSARAAHEHLTPEEQSYVESLDPVAFLVIHHDSILFEQYWDDYSPESMSSSFSMAKTFTSVLIGIAIGEGKIKSVDQPVADFIPSFREAGKEGITLRNLLTMSSGLNWDESYANPLSVTTEAYYGSDLEKLVDQMQRIEEPGKRFEYLSGNTLVLAEVLKKATGKTLSEYMSEKLWKPMGAARAASWSLDHPDGMEKAYCCINSNIRDFARLGKLFKNGGNWNGVQLVPADYVSESIVPARLTDEGQPLTRYGLSWWLLTYQGHSVFYARGILGQYVFVVPDLDLVVARLGHHRSMDYTDGHPQDVFHYLDIGIRMSLQYRRLQGGIPGL
ncbi:MAG: serine hydrolase [Flavobacteriales bacterium]|nr:serine hydrolase [Flavobacteriales bacterium]MCB9449556.1 serine hydrolase [Flavobacteriales bacterium]